MGHGLRSMTSCFLLFVTKFLTFYWKLEYACRGRVGSTLQLLIVIFLQTLCCADNSSVTCSQRALFCPLHVVFRVQRALRIWLFTSLKPSVSLAVTLVFILPAECTLHVSYDSEKQISLNNVKELIFAVVKCWMLRICTSPLVRNVELTSLWVRLCQFSQAFTAHLKRPCVLNIIVRFKNDTPNNYIPRKLSFSSLVSFCRWLREPFCCLLPLTYHLWSVRLEW
jgi:hypothetical protein